MHSTSTSCRTATGEGAADHSVDLDDGVSADLNAEGRVVGLEVLDASARLGPGGVEGATVERLEPLPATEVVSG